jgi:transposase-like protein
VKRRWFERVERPVRVHVEVEMVHDELMVPIVPFVPVRCPRCSTGYPITYGMHDLRAGRTRYHLCKECNTKFKSLELSVEAREDDGTPEVVGDVP